MLARAGVGTHVYKTNPTPTDGSLFYNLTVHIDRTRHKNVGPTILMFAMTNNIPSVLFRGWSPKSAGGLRSGKLHDGVCRHNFTAARLLQEFQERRNFYNRTPTAFVSTTSNFLRDLHIAIKGFTLAKMHDRSKLHSSRLEQTLRPESILPKTSQLEAGAQRKRSDYLKMNTFSFGKCQRTT
jgi:hypothetical protein